MTFVRIDGDGEAIPISEKVKNKYRPKPPPAIDDEQLYATYGGD
jgi:hypothetical protein